MLVLGLTGQSGAGKGEFSRIFRSYPDVYCLDTDITAREVVEKGTRGHNRIIGSRKVILVAEREEKEEAFWSKIEVDKICTGVVKSLTPFGAFVDIGGYDGLIHMSELSWNRIKHPSEVLSVGQEVEVKILEFDRKKKRISLGYRKQEDNTTMVNY